MFVDKVKVTIKAGDGGDGITSFRHEKFRKLGGPDGGNGGNGGNAVLQASRNQNTLVAFRYRKLLKAEDGKAGGKSKKHGKSGANLEVPVPVGTIVIDDFGQLLADFTSDGQTEVIARGGKGGFGNAHFVSSTRQAPRVAEKGQTGQQVEATLELKMIADVGLIGLPNAGKSTLLSVISNARPEIADYPFTTLVPNLGVVDVDKTGSLLFADIPGLIEGASQGKGLGDEFLRHVERTSVMVHLIDTYSENIAADYRTIIEELANYSIDLSKRPQIVVLTKIDGIDTKYLNKQLKTLKKTVPKKTPILAISSKSGAGVKELLRSINKLITDSRKMPTRRSLKSRIPIIGLREDSNTWQVRKIRGGFLVTGEKIERFAAKTKFGDYHSEARLRDIMRKIGIDTELQKQGVKPGQILTIGKPPHGKLEY